MGEKSGSDILLDALPSLKKWYNVIALYSFQILIFIAVMIILWQISSLFWYGAIVGQLILSTLLSIFFIILANNVEKIREKHKKKYNELVGQSFWYYYQSYTIPLISAAYYFPLFLINYDFLPRKIIYMPPHFLTNSLFPFYIAIPLGIFVLIIGYLMKRPSGGFGPDVDNYLYFVHPERSKLITKGMYQYIRNPQYLSRGIISMGFGIIANNISAILIGFIHFVSYCAIIPAEDREMYRRFGDVFKKYKDEVPAVFPRYGSWKKFVRFIFVKN